MQTCPQCGSTTQQHKIGLTRAGSQRYQCYACQCRYTPTPKHHGYAEEIRQRAVKLYLDGMNLRRIGRLLGVHHTSVMNWVNAYAEVVDDAPVPEQVETVEIEQQKNRLYLMTFVNRRTRCILSWRVVDERTGAVIQAMIHESVQARTYFSDAFEAYQTALYWPAEHYPMHDKSQTFSVEGDNAELRHY